MATLIGEIKGRKATSNSRERQFRVKAANANEFEDVIAAQVPVRYGQPHPSNPGYYAKDISCAQDGSDWQLWTVTVTYEKLSGEDKPSSNPFDNPLNRPAEITYDTQTINVAARGEVDSSGNLIKAIKTSAGEPYDPHPEEELEIMIINIVRWEGPLFSVNKFWSYQNSVNSDSFKIGDLTVNPGEAKLRISIGKKERHVAEDSGGTVTEYRQFKYTLAINPLGWDIKLLDYGTYYKDNSGNIKRFVDEGKEFGLLNGNGRKLPDGDPEQYNEWKNKVRKSFTDLNLPAGP